MIGQEISHYRLIEELGRGGMGIVYKAEDLQLHRYVALKFLPLDVARDPDALKRFKKEARAASALDHPNICTIYDIEVKSDQQPFIAMQFLDGQTLQARMKAQPLSVIDALNLTIQIADALEKAHAKGVIHLDLKPRNIFITNDGDAKLLDFGLATFRSANAVRSGKLSDSPTLQSQTMADGLIGGTPSYMSPEQVRLALVRLGFNPNCGVEIGVNLDPRSDLFSFGVVLYEMVTGVLPFQGETVGEIFNAILNTVPQIPDDLAKLQLPSDLGRIILKTLKKNPDQRYPTARDFKSDLELAKQSVLFPGQGGPLRELDVTIRSSADSRRLPAAWIAASSAVVLLLITIILIYNYRGQTSVNPPQPLFVEPPILFTESGEMMLIPAGPFQSGADKHTENLRAFYIDRTEVSNEVYRRFCQATGKEPPAGFQNLRADLPVVNVTINEAREFARWAGQRLPTANEWEKAARGIDGREYPWGNDADSARANVKTNGAALKPVTAFEEGDSPFKVRQMVGNAWEFVDERMQPSAKAVADFKTLLTPSPTINEAWYLIMGGSFENPLFSGATYEYGFAPARFHSKIIGFRCVKEASDSSR